MKKDETNMILPFSLGRRADGTERGIDLGKRSNSPLLVAGTASEEAKVHYVDGLLASLAASRSPDEAIVYVLGDEKETLRQFAPLPHMKRECPPLVRRHLLGRPVRLPHIENPCGDEMLGCDMIKPMLTLEMELRLKHLASVGICNMETLNRSADGRHRWPLIVVVVDGADASSSFPESEFYGRMDRLLALGGAAEFRFVFVSRDANGDNALAALIAALRFKGVVATLSPNSQPEGSAEIKHIN